MEVFEQVREHYRETVPVKTVLPWRGGDTLAESREAPGANGVLTYSLPFEVGQERHDIPFTRQELTECADPDHSEARFAIKQKILDTFTALESQ
jgi:hypothetical protein